MDRVLSDYYGGREDAFWKRPQKWPGGLTSDDNYEFFATPMSKLLGKRALVTAGAQGIGLAISSQLLRAGCDVFVHYHRSADNAKALAAEAKKLGHRCASASADLTSTEVATRSSPRP